MERQKDRIAEHLGEIFEAAYYQRLSGLLCVESVDTESLEEGEIYILAGQPIYAHIGKRTGQEALNYLLKWHMLRFSFAADAPRPPANLTFQASARFSPPPAPLEQIVPRKILLEQQVLSLRLTHRQRTVYFLSNGERTIADLAQCTGRTTREVELTLQELQRLGIIVV